MMIFIFLRDTDEKYAEEVSEKRLLQENENETEASSSRLEYRYMLTHLHVRK